MDHMRLGELFSNISLIATISGRVLSVACLVCLDRIEDDTSSESEIDRKQHHIINDLGTEDAFSNSDQPASMLNAETGVCGVVASCAT